MTIKELIEKLKTFPANTVVLVKHSGSKVDTIKQLDVGSFFPNPKEFIPAGSDEEDISNSILLS